MTIAGANACSCGADAVPPFDAGPRCPAAANSASAQWFARIDGDPDGLSQARRDRQRGDIAGLRVIEVGGDACGDTTRLLIDVGARAVVVTNAGHPIVGGPDPMMAERFAATVLGPDERHEISGAVLMLRR